MSVSHARVTLPADSAACADHQVPRLLEVLALVPDPRRKRGRRYGLVFVLAVAAVCALSGARNFREAADQAADLPLEVPARLGGKPHPLRRRITAHSEKRIRTLLQALDAAALDAAIGGKWLRGVADGQVKLFAAILHGDGAIIAQHRIPDETNEITQVRDLLDPVDLTGAVVTADAAHAQHDTAEYIAGER
jgi:hypothetical protein